MKEYPCPVCGYQKLKHPTADYSICVCCGTEFGYDDFGRSHAALTVQWIVDGQKWHSRRTPPPYNWDPNQQLVDAGLFYLLKNVATTSAVSKTYIATDANYLRNGVIQATATWVAL